MGIAIAIGFVDPGGNPIAFYRMPAAFLASSDYSHWKAWTAASFSMGTSAFASMLADLAPYIRQGLLAHPTVTDLPGGLPILSEHRLLGAVGVSGGSGEQDDAIAGLVVDLLANSGT